MKSQPSISDIAARGPSPPAPSPSPPHPPSQTPELKLTLICARAMLMWDCSWLTNLTIAWEINQAGRSQDTYIFARLSHLYCVSPFPLKGDLSSRTWRTFSTVTLQKQLDIRGNSPASVNQNLTYIFHAMLFIQIFCMCLKLTIASCQHLVEESSTIFRWRIWLTGQPEYQKN